MHDQFGVAVFRAKTARRAGRFPFRPDTLWCLLNLTRCQGHGLVQLTLVGRVEPLPLAVNPNVVEAPAARVPLYAALFTVIAPLVPLFTPLHRLLMLCPLASVRPTVQALSVDDPLLATVTLA